MKYFAFLLHGIEIGLIFFILSSQRPDMSDKAFEIETRIDNLEKRVQEYDDRITILQMVQNRAIEEITKGLNRRCDEKIRPTHK